MKDTYTERCERCGVDTEHRVAIEIRQESEAVQSREPYRVSECTQCGFTSSTRMNNEETVSERDSRRRPVPDGGESADPSVECVYCDEQLPWDEAHEEIVEHHTRKHPHSRYAPHYYPDPTEGSDGPPYESADEKVDWLLEESSEGSDDYLGVPPGEVSDVNPSAEELFSTEGSDGDTLVTPTEPEFHPIETSEGSDDAAQPMDPEERIEAGNEAKFTPFGHPITANEVHAMAIGAVTGPLAALLWHLGRHEAALAVAGILVGVSLLGKPFLRSLPHTDAEYEDTMALRTIRYEPWWFNAAFAVAVGVASLAL